jgi:F-type H+-transporting ATPase subunit epsilon
MPLSLQIVTPERVVFSEEGIDSVTLPGSEGELTILPSHAPLMTALQPGPLLFRRGSEEVDVALSGGFMEVREDKVVILADTAERSDEIDIARAEAARLRAAELLATREGAIDIAATMAALERASARIRVAERRRRRPGARTG